MGDDSKGVSVKISSGLGDFGLYMLVIFLMHCTIVTRGCEMTEQERADYIEALPWVQEP